MSPGEAQLGDVVLLADDVADYAAPGAAWLAHAVMPSPHAATAKKPKMTERSRTAGSGERAVGRRPCLRITDYVKPHIVSLHLSEAYRPEAGHRLP